VSDQGHKGMESFRFYTWSII